MAAELKAELDAVEGHVPRYLYRTYSNESKGKNSLWIFEPECPVNTGKLSDIERQQGKRMLENHLLWKIFSGDEFISWTSSLLWVLQHAIRKDVKGESDVMICVLDTSKVETCSFFAVSDLLRIYKISDEQKLCHRYYVAEYVYHGGIPVHSSSSTVPLELLREHGLFSLLPEMDDPSLKQYLCISLDRLRNTMFQAPSPVSSLIEGRTALQLASLFGNGFTMPVMVALLSLRSRDPDDVNFLKLIADYADPSQDFTTTIPQSEFIITNHNETPELVAFAQLMNAAHAAVTTQSAATTEPREREEESTRDESVEDLSTRLGNLGIMVQGGGGGGGEGRSRGRLPSSSSSHRSKVSRAPHDDVNNTIEQTTEEKATPRSETAKKA